jgi:hypothetical protein
MDYAATQPAASTHDAVVTPLGGGSIAPTLVSIARDIIVAMPFPRSEIDTRIFAYDD